MLPRGATPILCLVLSLLTLLVRGQTTPPPRITQIDPTGLLGFERLTGPGVVNLMTAELPSGPWSPLQNQFINEAAGTFLVQAPVRTAFYQLRAFDVGPTAAGFQNLVSTYGLLDTLAGNGAGQIDGTSYWQPEFEGAPARTVALSRPHAALADAAGRIFIVDRDSHSVLRVDLDGTLHTHAGTHSAGLDGEGPKAANKMKLNAPNGLWVRPDSTVYILDTDNGRVRKVSPAGIATTLFLATSDGSGLNGGRGLWVREDDALAYFCAGTKVRKWTRKGGLSTLADGFTDLGMLWVNPDGNLMVCDRGGNRVYRVTPDGRKEAVAGNGGLTGGGDGFPALETGLYGVRGIWPVPTGGYLLLTHEGSQLWYWDSGGIIHLMMNGGRGRTHAGDGLPFFGPEPRISEGRSVSLDAQGNILLCESDYGYIRRIQFLPVSW